MMNKKNLLAAVAAVCAGSALAAVEMGAPFTDGAVLQRGMKVPVWGKVVPAPGQSLCTVKVEFAGQGRGWCLAGRPRPDGGVVGKPHDEGDRAQ